MVIVLIIVFVVMASEITRAVPRMFVTVVIGEIFAIEAIYTKQSNYAEKTTLSAICNARSSGARNKKGHACNSVPFVRLYSAAITASPIATVPTCLQSGVTISAVR
ncbi:hypothetical protein C7402_10219 [Paraburkholderia unamae]|uniref:Secreted protein n=1 Tax=Paraburkholderia unamae TaxID=219649 RepID=A0ABX5KSU1_9BURK|nr:hypothetical protein C7402_10219 [Paraburkholderia unamae]RAR68268.1 hypothetical protein C7401_101508 [Paraburkholderia unamae]